MMMKLVQKFKKKQKRNARAVCGIEGEVVDEYSKRDY